MPIDIFGIKFELFLFERRNKKQGFIMNINKIILKLLGSATMIFILSGCYTQFGLTRHDEDYQEADVIYEEEIYYDDEAPEVVYHCHYIPRPNSIYFYYDPVDSGTMNQVFTFLFITTAPTGVTIMVGILTMFIILILIILLHITITHHPTWYTRRVQLDQNLDGARTLSLSGMKEIFQPILMHSHLDPGPVADLMPIFQVMTKGANAEQPLLNGGNRILQRRAGALQAGRAAAADHRILYQNQRRQPQDGQSQHLHDEHKNLLRITLPV